MDGGAPTSAAPGPARTGMLSGFTRLSKLLAACMVTGYLLTALVPITKDYLCLVPGRTIPWVSMLFTAGFTELNPWALVAEVAGLLLLTKSIEPVYGSKEFVRFLFVVNVATSVATLVVMYLLYVATLDFHHLYEHFYGGHGLIAALLVAVKHIMPDHEVVLFGALRFRAKYAPSLYLVLLTAIALVPGVDEEQLLPYAWFGAYFAWWFLRFAQPKADGSAPGDTSDAFAFATFFPPFLHGPVDKVAKLCALLFRLHAREKAVSAATAALPRGAGAADHPDAQRRRERGAKALEARLVGIAGLKQAQASEKSAAVTADVEIGGAPAPGSGSGTTQ